MASWRLKLENDSGPSGTVELELVMAEGTRAHVGRGADCEIVCRSDACSRRHCAFVVVDGKVCIEDSGSSNGTWLNGQKVRRAEVKVGDKIHAGRPRLVVLALEPLP